MPTVLVCGAGIFGLTAALELRKRGYDVTVTDPGPIPNPDAESTDSSKAIRVEYGADETYTAFMEEALDGWREWDRQWVAENGESLFHETGVMYVSREAMAPGGFEHDSYEVLMRRDHLLERLDAAKLRERFPAWSTGAYVDGYFNRTGGYAESGRVVARLCARAIASGVNVIEGFGAIHITDDNTVEDGSGRRISADAIVVAAGAWTSKLVPELSPHLLCVAQPVFHLRPAEPALFEAVRFPTFGADIAKTGYYGFPIMPDGTVKIANHGPGFRADPDAPRVMLPEHEPALRAFLRDTFPALADAPVAETRICIYCDTKDEHFWIAPHPARPNLVVATGGSGHAFKFAPLLGRWIADAVEGRVVDRFRWRTGVALHGVEAARHHGPV